MADTNDYILRGDALDAIRERINQVGMKTPLVLSIGQAVVDVPAADVRPVIHAYWKEIEDFDGDVLYYECSHCGEAWTLIAGTPKENNMAFCNRCGAMMGGEVQDGT